MNDQNTNKIEMLQQTTPTYFQEAMNQADEFSLQVNTDIAANEIEIDEKKRMAAGLLAEIAVAAGSVEEVSKVQTELLEKTQDSAQRLTKIVGEVKELFPSAKHRGMKREGHYNETSEVQDYPKEYVDIDDTLVAEYLGDREVQVHTSRRLVEARYTNEDSYDTFHARFDTDHTFVDGQNGLEVIVQGQGGRQSTVAVSDGLRSMELTPAEVQEVQGLTDLVSELFPGVTLEARLGILASTGFGATDDTKYKEWDGKFKKLQKEYAPLIDKDLSLTQMFDLRERIGLSDNSSWSDSDFSLVRSDWDRQDFMKRQQTS